MPNSDAGTVDKYRKALLLQQQLQTRHRTDVVDLPTDSLEPNPLQPRRSFDPQAMEELRNSIAQHGILEPLLVRPLAAGRYQIVVGERRWRCAQDLGLETVPAIIRRLSDQEAFQLSLVENLQRSNLSPIEEARAYQYMLDSGMAQNQQQIAEMLGIAPQRVSEKLRLLDLPEPIQERVSPREEADLSAGTISERHARALLKLPDPDLQLQALDEILEKRLGTRQAEELVRNMLAQEKLPTERRRSSEQEETEQKTEGRGFLPPPPKIVRIKDTPYGFVMRVEYDCRYVSIATVISKINEALAAWSQEQEKKASKKSNS